MALGGSGPRNPHKHKNPMCGGIKDQNHKQTQNPEMLMFWWSSGGRRGRGGCCCCCFGWCIAVAVAVAVRCPLSTVSCPLSLSLSLPLLLLGLCLCLLPDCVSVAVGWFAAATANTAANATTAAEITVPLAKLTVLP